MSRLQLIRKFYGDPYRGLTVSVVQSTRITLEYGKRQRANILPCLDITKRFA